MKTLQLTQERAQEVLTYDFEAGVLRWKERAIEEFPNEHRWKTWNVRFAGKVAGYLSTNKRANVVYRHVKIDNVAHLAHRVINLMVTGSRNELDFIDGNPLNLAWNNLREATPTENNRNRRRFKNNSTGVTGVYKDKKGKYVAIIGSNKDRVVLGKFDSLDKAKMVRKKAERELGYHPNHGRK